MGFHGEYEFVIPLSLDALQEASSTRQYVVSNISTANEIPKKLQECQSTFRKEGCSFVLDGQMFDALYSVLWHFKYLDAAVQDNAFNLMVKVMTQQTTDLASLLDDIANVSASARSQNFTILKMNTFLAVQLTEAFENHHNKPSQDAFLATGKSRKRAAGGAKEDNQAAWENQRMQMLLQLCSVLHHPLHKLCSPPIMEEDYVNLVANMCYKILESPSMGQNRCKGVRDSLFQIIGVLVNRFNHGLACSLKTMQLVQHFEHLASVCAQGLAMLVNQFGCMNVIGEVVREIAKMDLGCMETSSKDSAAVRNFTLFLVELAELVPQALVPSLPLLFTFLDNDNSSLRNCMLSMMGSLVLRVLSSENLDDKKKDLRDNCIDAIEDHVMDVNAFVRSKVLQIIHDLVKGGGVPLARQQRLLELAVGRIMDKSASVRKNAISLLTAFLKQNPFAAKLPMADLQQQYEIEQEKLMELCPESVTAPEIETRSKENTVHQLWQEKLPALVDAVRDVIDEDSDAEDFSDDQLSEDCSLNDALSAIAVALDTGKLHRAAVLLSGALEAFHGATVLSYDPSTSVPPQLPHKDAGDELTPLQLQHLALLERIFLSSHAMNNKENGEHEEPVAEQPKESEEVTKQRKLVTYLKDSVGFAKQLAVALPLVAQLLCSKLVSDSLEAIKFFVTSFEFGVLDAMSGVREMLVLVWSQEQQVQSAVVEAYRQLYVTGGESGASDRCRAVQIVRNLTSLTTGANLGELASLEVIIAQFMANGDLNKACITLLWERFTLALPDTSPEESKAALTLLAMAANSEPSIVSSNIGVLIDTAFGTRGEQDFGLVKQALIALSKVATDKAKTEDASASFRLEASHEMFTRLSDLLVEGITREEDRQYGPMAVQAATTIYALSEHPDQVCGSIIKRIHEKMMKLKKADDDTANSPSEAVLVPTTLLKRFLMFVGRVAICQLVHLDTSIFSELKRRNHLKEQHDNAKKEKKKTKTKKKEEKNKRKSLMTSATEASLMRNSSQEGDLDEELGMMGAVADDMEAEYIRSVCDKEIVTGPNLLAAVMPVIECVCSNTSQYRDPELRRAAALALANCMMVSADCCEQHLQLLFTILEKSDDAVIRGNIIIALGDLSFRFPNLVEPWTPRIYARLRDDCCSVRHNTITVLTHLILNDMVKVKGQIADIALCITDKEPRINGLAKLFFTELARKPNALYNVLPDIISRLSDPQIDLDELKYRTVISHIFSLIQKDKQVEGLVEKLCHRLQASSLQRQWRDIAYCLSLLQYNERCVRKFAELFPCYGDKLHEPDVHKMFLSVLAKARKIVKPETKAVVEELEAKIEASHSKAMQEQNLLNKATAAKGDRAATTKRANVRVAKRKNRRSDSDSDDEDFNSSNEENVAQPVKQPDRSSRRIGSRRQPAVAHPKVVDSSTDESEQSDASSGDSEADSDETGDADKRKSDESPLREKPQSKKPVSSTKSRQRNGPNVRLTFDKQTKCYL
ncbi:condensin complex subunit 1 isoform X2 [Hyalella azteca]|uniref:Condensin complex subunit 1 n=1 Tax=Hyalella azteca TaxID=294128 RepID=A0A8B7NPT5_HYAAZ|nr:condensin complex subunit 1 isoform X2 [Hyalella azteca]